MDCACVYSGVDSISIEFFDKRYPKARKSHTCYECHKEIVIGDKYEYTVGVWEGYFDTYKTCMDCAAIRDCFFCEGFIFGEVWWDLVGHIREMGGDILTWKVSNLPKEAQWMLFEKIEEYWEETDEEYWG